MKIFETLNRAWPSAAEAFAEDFALGARVQEAPWGGLAVLGHAELTALARHPAAEGMAADPAAMAAAPRVLALLNRALFTQSGPLHRQNRAAAVAAFNTLDLGALTARAVAEATAGEARDLDLREGFAGPLAAGVWARVVGHGAGDAARLARAVADLGRVLGPSPDPARAGPAEAAAEEIRALTQAAFAAGTPFTRTLRAALGDETAADLIAGMAFDALDTAALALADALRVAARRPGRLAATPACAGECLRLASSAAMTMRQAAAPIRLGALQIAEGTVLSMVWAAGNHDPSVFPDPATFDPARGGARPLTFGLGAPACLGHALMRSTLQALLGFVIARRPAITGLDAPWRPLGPRVAAAISF